MKNKMNFKLIPPLAALLLALPLAGAALIDFEKPVKAVLHTAEKRGQSSRPETFDGVKALRVDWDSARSKYFEFHYQPTPQLPAFLTARIRVKAYIPAECKARNLNLRLTDTNNEVFQFSALIPAGEGGWREFTYAIDARKPKAGTWGGGDKANKQLDFPVRLAGFACDFNVAEGMGYIGIGAVEIEVLKAGEALQPALRTGSPVNVVTPDSARPAVVLKNDRLETVRGELEFRLTDAFGTEAAAKKETLTVAPGEEKAFELPVKRFGVYGVEVQYREEDPELKPVAKRFSFAYMQPSGPTPGRAAGFLFGVCSHPQGASTADQEREALAAALCGVKVMRTDMYWEHIQPTPADVWNFRRFDAMLENFAKQNIEVQAIYCYLPRWAAASDQQPLSAKYKGKPRPDYEHWRTFIRHAAEHYRDKLRYVEVWNEPDHVGFANFPVSEYIEMMKIAYIETKKAAPDMTVLTGGYTCMPGSFEKMMEKNHMERTLTEGKGFYDIFAFHGHGSFLSYRSQIERLVKMRRDLDLKAPWYANETAISSMNIGELAQAITLYQKFLYSWARGAMGYNWYDLRNDGFDLKNNEHNFGLLSKDFQPKAAYGVYNMLSRLFHQAEYLNDAKVDGVFGFFFRAKNGDLLLPAWSEDRERLLMFSGVTGKVFRVDLFGNEEELAVENGSLTAEVRKQPATLRFTGMKLLPEIHGEFFRQLDDFSCRPGQSRKYRFELLNPTDKPLEFRLDLRLPEGLTLRPYPRRVTVAPRKAETVAFEIAAAENFRSFHGEQKQLELSLGAGRFWQGTLSFPAHSVTVLEKQLRREPDFILNRAEQAVFLAPNNPQSAHLFWKGPEDLSAKIYLGHDGGNLLLKAEVTDDIHCQPYSGEGSWRGDGIQFALKLPNQKEFWEIGLARLDNGQSDVYLWFVPDKFNPKQVADAISLTTERNEKTRLTTYLAKIPFTAIGLDREARRNGFRFNLLVNDNDGEIRETFLSIAPGIGENKTPDSYPFVLFNE